jgi:rubrerythrin
MSKANQSLTTLGSALELAVWLEKHGQAFYENARRDRLAPELDTLFTWLAEDEKKHGQIYTRLFEDCTGQAIGETAPLGEYGLFIELMRKEVSRHLTIEPGLSPLDLLDRALQFEKDTLLYFHEIGALFPSDQRTPIDAICAEERQHVRQLLALRHQLADA